MVVNGFGVFSQNPYAKAFLGKFPQTPPNRANRTHMAAHKWVKTEVPSGEAGKGEEKVSERSKEGWLLTELAALPPGAMVDEQRLARLLGVTDRTVRRMVRRGELPPPVRLGGRAVWLAGRVLAHVERRAEEAARRAEKEARRIAALSP